MEAMKPIPAKEYLKTVKKPSKSKMGNLMAVYNGVKYQSNKEARYAMSLDLRMRTGEVLRWERQLSYKLGAGGVYITEYRLDFKVWLSDGRIEHIDVKGRKAGVPYDLFLIKKRLMKAILDIDVIEV